MAAGHQQVVNLTPDAVTNPSNAQGTLTAEQGNCSVVNDRQVLRLKLPELLKYLSTLPEHEQRQTIELIRLLKARKLKQNEENNIVSNSNTASSLQIKPLDSPAGDVQRTIEKTENPQISKSAAVSEDKKGSQVTQDFDPTKHGKETECPAGCYSPIGTNSKWQQHLSEAVNIQSGNTDGESHKSTHEQQITPEKQSMKSELLELIRKTCFSQGSGQHHNRETTEQKVLSLEENTYQTIGTAQEINVRTSMKVGDDVSTSARSSDDVSTSARLGDVVNRETDKKVYSDTVITSTEQIKTQDTHIVGNLKRHGAPTRMSWQISERKEIPHSNSNRVCLHQEIQSQMSMKTMPDTKFSAVPTSNSVIPHQMSSEAGSAAMPETSLIQTSPVFTTTFFSPNNMSPQEITLVAQPECSELTDQPYQSANTFINVQTSNQNILTETSNGAVIKQQNDGLVSEHPRRHGPFTQQVAPQQLQPLQTVQLPYTIQNVAQHVLQVSVTFRRQLCIFTARQRS